MSDVQMLNQVELKRVLDYNPKTGEFRWKVSNSNRVSVGDIAGSKRNSRDGYTSIKIHGKPYYAQRLAYLYMTGEWPKCQIEHINNDPQDNRLLNLRESSRQEINDKINKKKINKHGIKGLYWNNQSNKWNVRVTKNGESHQIGVATNIFDAACLAKGRQTFNAGEMK